MGATAPLLALTAAQTYQQYQGQRAQSDLMGKLDDINRTNAEFMADDVIKRGDKEAAAHRGKTKRLIGSQRAAMAASGVDVNSGSFADVQSSTQSQGERDALTIKGNAWREALGIRSQAAGASSGVSLSRAGLKNDSRNTLLTGGLRFTEYARGK